MTREDISSKALTLSKKKEEKKKKTELTNSCRLISNFSHKNGNKELHFFLLGTPEKEKSLGNPDM